ncbi:MAG: GlcG/HbpS family heme-binding protein [Gemmatimonadota bacterium]
MRSRTLPIALLISALLAPASSGAQEARRPLTFDMAQQAMDAAEAEARANEWGVTIVITDHEGVPVYLRRLDGASPRSYEVAMAKASTVVATGMTTAEYGAAVEAGEAEEIPDGIAFAGGVPVVLNGELIGAIATSGVRAIQDEEVSRAGADAIDG